MLSYFQAIVLGLLQGVTELFPVSSLGHTVLLPALLGWNNLVRAQSAPESFYLAFVVALHVGTALALFLFFWRDWVRIVKGFVQSLARRRIETPDQRLAWLLVVATIPAGITGVALEHALRTQFAKPLWQRYPPEPRRAVPSPAAGSTPWTSGSPSSSAWPRSERSSPGSAARASRWSPGWSGD